MGLAVFFRSVLDAGVCTLGTRFAATPAVLGAELFGDVTPMRALGNLIPSVSETWPHPAPVGEGTPNPSPGQPRAAPSSLCGARVRAGDKEGVPAPLQGWAVPGAPVSEH